jgi:hypothetical protein
VRQIGDPRSNSGLHPRREVDPDFRHSKDIASIAKVPIRTPVRLTITNIAFTGGDVLGTAMIPQADASASSCTGSLEVARTGGAV